MNHELESHILFNMYGIVGYASDGPGMRDGETHTNDDHQCGDGGEGLIGDTQGHSDD